MFILYSIKKMAKQLRISRNDAAINEYALKFGKIIEKVNPQLQLGD